MNAGKKVKSIRSDAYPPSKIDGNRDKVTPQSETHQIIQDLSLEIDKSKVKYKRLSRIHMKEITNLHKEWFPVRYEDSFYERALNITNNSFIAIGAMYPTEEKELIVGSILIEIQNFLEKFKKHSSEAIMIKLSNEISFSDEMSASVSWKDYHCAYIMTLGVIDECRRMKFGTELINRAIEAVLDDPLCICLYLDVIEYNTSALEFYQKNGFEKVTVMGHHYDINKTTYDSNVLVKVLTQKEKSEHQRKKNGFVYQSITDSISLVFYSFIALITFNLFFKCLRKKHKLD